MNKNYNQIVFLFGKVIYSLFCEVSINIYENLLSLAIFFFAKLFSLKIYVKVQGRCLSPEDPPCFDFFEFGTVYIRSLIVESLFMVVQELNFWIRDAMIMWLFSTNCTLEVNLLHLTFHWNALLTYVFAAVIL